MQLYDSAPLQAVDCMRDRLRDCSTDVGRSCASRRLNLNDEKTELIWFGKRARLDQLANMDRTVTVGTSVIKPTDVVHVRNLGVLLDSGLTMKQHIATGTSICFY